MNIPLECRNTISLALQAITPIIQAESLSQASLDPRILWPLSIKVVKGSQTANISVGLALIETAWHGIFPLDLRNDTSPERSCRALI